MCSVRGYPHPDDRTSAWEAEAEAEAAWLDPHTVNPGDLLPLLAPYPADGMVTHPVSREVGNVRNEGPDLVVPIELPALMPAAVRRPASRQDRRGGRHTHPSRSPVRR
jgi:hypothetical protein